MLYICMLIAQGSPNEIHTLLGIKIEWNPGVSYRCNCLFVYDTVPDDAPANVRVTGTSPSSVLVRWMPPSIPNGIITGYTLYINYTDGSPVAVIQSSSTDYTVNGLQPYQLISVRLSASTSAGEGPSSDVVMGRATEMGMFIL